MQKGKQLLLALLLMAAASAFAEESAQMEARQQVHDVISGLTAAWQTGDGDAWAEAFVEDADFTVWFGMSLKGREQIARGHQLIFDSFYANTRFELAVKQIRFLGDDAAVVHLQGTVLAPGQASPTEPDAVPIAILSRMDDSWKIVAFQNTPFVVNEFRRNGDLTRFKRQAAEQQASP